MKKKIHIGTRGSKLALWQADFIKSRIKKISSKFSVEIIIIKTRGDRILDRPLSMVGGKGLFVKEIENALLNNEIDIAVHSMKDMPGMLPEGLAIGAVPERENPFDVLVSKNSLLLKNYRQRARIGTSSLRRGSQIKNIRPDLNIVPARGNLDTRIRKLKSGEYDAILLAAAGLIRLGLEHEITEYLDEITMVPAVGQGALCIEARENDKETDLIMKELDHYPTRACVSGERAFLKKIEGSCHIPAACFGKFTGDKICLTGIIGSKDGQEVIREKTLSPADEVETYGEKLASELLEKGGRKILENLNQNER